MPGFDVKASAPGKILLLGGYSILERPNIGYVTTVNSRVHVRIRHLEGHQVKVSAPQFGVSGSGTVDPKTGELSFDLPPGMEVFKTAVEIPIKYLVCLGADVPGFHLEAYNDASFSSGKTSKSGLGSSAGVTVAGIAAALAVSKHGSEASTVDKELVHKLAQISHSIATRKVGSGFDIAAATYGSMVYTRYSPNLIESLPQDYTCDDIVKLTKTKWDYKIDKLALPEMFGMVYAGFRNESASTVSFVSKVKQFKEENPEGYEDMIKQINGANISALKALKDINNEETREQLDMFREHFETGRRLTKELGNLADIGIEPDECSEIIEGSKQNGAFVAKLPGSGGKDSLVALTTDEGSRRGLVRYLESVKELTILDVNPNNAGVKIELG